MVGEWLSTTQAAQALGVSADTVKRWADAGDIACIRLPSGHRRFSTAAIEAILKGGDAA